MGYPVTTPIFRAALSSKPANGHEFFVPQVRKIVFEYCDVRKSSDTLRRYLLRNAETLASKNPHVEIVVKQRSQKQPIIRGLYVNNRTKVIGLNGYDAKTLEQKIQLLLDSSGAKIKALKRKPVESMTESARGIWSGLHVEETFKI